MAPLQHQQPSAVCRPEVTPATRLVYAVSGAPQHDRKGHPECAARVTAILQELAAVKCTPDDRPDLVLLPETRPATLEQVAAVHSRKYVDDLRALIERDAPVAIADHDDPDGVTYVTPSTFDDALKAAGAAMELVDVVVAASRARPQQPPSSAASSPTSRPGSAGANTVAGYGVVRPPGHHTTHNEAMGFCMFNNVAIAARHAQQHHGLKKVMVLDYDVHHGNGTHDLFYNDPSVLMIDIHQEAVWPGGGQIHEVGAGEGTGFTMNVPLPHASGDTCLKHVFDIVVAPAIRRFQPDMMLVSAGHDAHWRDPLEKLQFQSSTYHYLARSLKRLADQLCGGRLVFLLEGGYSLQGVSEGVAESFLALLGAPPAHLQETVPLAEPVDQVALLVQQLKLIHDV